MIRRVGLLALLALAALATPAAAQPVQRERVHFQRGHSDTTITDHVTGRGSIEYTLGARAGQTLRLELTQPGTSVYFNVFEPGKRPGRDEALFIGESSGTTMEVRLAQTGDYMIQVFQNRAAARRGGRATFTLHVAITGGAAAAPAPSGDARLSVTQQGDLFRISVGAQRFEIPEAVITGG